MGADRDEAVPLEQPLTDPAGFIALYRREGEMVLSFCARRVLDAEVAVDITAETFAQAFRGRGRFRGTTDAEARAWLLTIARRGIAQYLRRGTLDRRAREKLGMQTPRVDAGAAEEIERLADLDALRAALAEELARLGADQRQALQLRVVEERPYPEIARLLGVTEATARARVSRGLRTLASSLELRSITQGDHG